MTDNTEKNKYFIFIVFLFIIFLEYLFFNITIFEQKIYQKITSSGLLLVLIIYFFMFKGTLIKGFKKIFFIKNYIEFLEKIDVALGEKPKYKLFIFFYMYGIFWGVFYFINNSLLNVVYSFNILGIIQFFNILSIPIIWLIFKNIIRKNQS